LQGQPLKTNRFTLERSKELMKKAKQAAAAYKLLAFETDVLEEIGYRNSPYSNYRIAGTQKYSGGTKAKRPARKPGD
jgi:hypothetical protein